MSDFLGGNDFKTGSVGKQLFNLCKHTYDLQFIHSFMDE